VQDLTPDSLAALLDRVLDWAQLDCPHCLAWRAATRKRQSPAWKLNLVEGVVDHHILTIHHVREGVGHQTAYDLGFLASGALLLIGGRLLARSAEARVAKAS
jgi:Predicted membrane protein (DUF2243)